MHNVNNNTTTGAFGFSESTSQQAPQNAQQGAFGPRAAIGTGIYDNSVTIYCLRADGSEEAKATIYLKDRVVAAVAKTGDSDHPWLDTSGTRVKVATADWWRIYLLRDDGTWR
ncbi:hypothetical protein [Endozoicomonas sp. 2B-B]